MDESKFDALLGQLFSGSVDIGFPRDFTASEAVAFMSTLFRQPAKHLECFSRAQVSAGLEYLVRPAGSELPLSLLDAGVPLEEKLICCARVENIFREIFSKYCVPAYVHKSETSDAMNIVCFLWWEYFPTFFHMDTRDGRALQEGREGVMRRILKIDSPACRESVIHGFGHLLEDRPEVAGTVLNQCVTNNALQPELRKYAESLLAGARV